MYVYIFYYIFKNIITGNKITLLVFRKNKLVIYYTK